MAWPESTDRLRPCIHQRQCHCKRRIHQNTSHQKGIAEHVLCLKDSLDRQEHRFRKSRHSIQDGSQDQSAKTAAEHKQPSQTYRGDPLRTHAHGTGIRNIIRTDIQQDILREERRISDRQERQRKELQQNPCQQP